LWLGGQWLLCFILLAASLLIKTASYLASVASGRPGTKLFGFVTLSDVGAIFCLADWFLASSEYGQYALFYIISDALWSTDFYNFQYTILIILFSFFNLFIVWLHYYRFESEIYEDIERFAATEASLKGARQPYGPSAERQFKATLISVCVIFLISPLFMRARLPVEYISNELNGFYVPLLIPSALSILFVLYIQYSYSKKYSVFQS
tara:strand:- start:3439 stop:4059 length:621 start_codon:yes stop_codon:yes gene_type:complete